VLAIKTSFKHYSAARNFSGPKYSESTAQQPLLLLTALLKTT